MSAPADRIAADWIAVDWGTTRLRAYAMDADGAAIGRAESDKGMSSLTPDRYETTLLDMVGGWLAPGRRTRVVICGMAGSRQGWIEAPYLEIGGKLADASANAVRPTTADPRLSVFILPGVMQAAPPDVMRGEETQLLGLLHRAPDFDGLACLPGTHSKWAHVAGGAARWFHTYMTGELFSALGAHTVLRHSLGAEGWDDGAFRDQIAAEAATPTPVTRGLFGLRARDLLEGAAPAEIRARLSAMLIGAEIADGLKSAQGRSVQLLASGDLGDRYALALRLFGAEVVIADAAEAILDGLRAANQRIEET